MGTAILFVQLATAFVGLLTAVVKALAEIRGIADDKEDRHS